MYVGSGGVAGTRELREIANAHNPIRAGTVTTGLPEGQEPHLKGEICAMVTITLIGSWAENNNPQKKKGKKQTARGTKTQ